MARINICGGIESDKILEFSVNRKYENVARAGVGGVVQKEKKKSVP